MGNESGTWVMYGVNRDDPSCIHSVEEAIAYINQIGFLPLFKNEIPGFSLEERTVAEYWWSGDLEKDPWAWRELITRSGRVVYGKFFDKKAGFLSTEWLPVFANFRRDGYDFDALYEDGKAPLKHKKIMNHFLDEQEEAEILSNELKQLAGFGKDGEKGYDTVVTALMMELYLCNCDFRRKRNKKGQEYGWPVAVYATPEHVVGKDVIRADYREAPEASWQKIVNHMREVFPVATDKQIQKVLGMK